MQYKKQWVNSPPLNTMKFNARFGDTPVQIVFRKAASLDTLLIRQRRFWILFNRTAFKTFHLRMENIVLLRRAL